MNASDKARQIVEKAGEMKRLLNKYPEIRLSSEILDDVGKVAFYLAMRELGESHNMADVCATRRTPSPQTDTAYASRFGTLDKQLEPARLAVLKAEAKRLGVSVNPNDIYDPGIARYAGDPLAMVDRQNARSALKRYCEQQGIGCEELGTKHRQPEKDPFEIGKHVSPHVSAQMALQEFRTDERNLHLPRKEQGKKLAELQEKAADKHGFDPNKRPSINLNPKQAPVEPVVLEPKRK